jgi:hypothetical protein
MREILRKEEKKMFGIGFGGGVLVVSVLKPRPARRVDPGLRPVRV